MPRSAEASHAEEKRSGEQSPRAEKGRNRHGAKGLRRREEILDAARAQLGDSENGSGLLRSVAKDLEISLGNLQYYFPTREDLLAALFRAESDSDCELIDLLSARDETPRDRLAAITRAFIARWEDGPAGTTHVPIWRALADSAQQSPRFRALRHELWERNYELLTPILRELEPGATASQLRLKAVLVAAMIDGTTMMPPETLESIRGLRHPSYENEVVAAVLWIAER